jgi:molybdate transport system substrate-binding protein
MVSVPPDLQVGPEYALALLKGADPLAIQFALYVLSPAGQALLARSGFITVTLPKAER